ncbi:phosphate signaling complex protein PhoU [Geomicrobium halophilum]|nr:phosphate signaling complex protein PhoU [Geomicrobium halophilum]
MSNFSIKVKSIEWELYEMGQTVAAQMENVKDVLFEDRSKTIVKELIERDKEVDQKDNRIHSSIIHLIILQPPLPEELRALTMMMRIAREFERIGDQVVNIAEIRIESDVDNLKLYTSEAFEKGYIKMLQLSGKMMAETLEAMTNKDRDLKGQIEQLDEEVDDLFFYLQHQIVQDMKESPGIIEKLAPLFLVIRYVERMADHVVNVSRRLRE